MKPESDLLAIEEKTYREHHSDGHTELIIGAGLVLMGLFDFLNFNPITINLILIGIFVPLFQWNKWVLIPRVGHVQFQDAIIKRETTRFAIVLGFFFLIVVATLFILISVHDKFRYWFEASDAGAFLFIGSVATFCFWGIAIARKAMRHFLFGMVNAIGWGLALWYNFDPFYSLSVLGLMMALYGAVTLSKFLKAHPKLQQPVLEPSHPAVDSEFEQKESYERILYNYCNTDGTTELMFGFGYLIIVVDFFRKVTLNSFYLFVVGILVFYVWKYWLTRRHVGKELFKIVRQYGKKLYSPLINMAIVFPYMIFMMLRDYLSKQTLVAFDTVLDFLIIGLYIADAVIMDAYFKVGGCTKKVMLSVILYLGLLASPLSSKQSAFVCGSAFLIWAVVRAVQFIRTTPPKPQEQS